MEQAEKKELLGNLYALRAGLSVISQEKDNADKALEEYSDITYKASRKIHNAKNWLASADSKRRAAKNEYENQKRVRDVQYQNDKNKIDKNSYYVKAPSLALVILRYILIVAVIAGAVALCWYCIDKFINAINVADEIGYFTDVVFTDVITMEVVEEVEKQFWKWLGCSIGAVLLSVLAMVLLYFFVIRRGTSIKRRRRIVKKIREKNQLAATYKQDVAVIDQDLANKLDAIDKKEAKTEKDLIYLQKEYDQAVEPHKKELSVKLALYKDNATQIYKVLKSKFSEMLDERDWKYLDLYIYMYETGRAESKKEALQLIDQYIQNQNIVEAVNRAGSAVCATLKSGFSKVRDAIGTACMAINTTMRELHSETMLKMDRITNRLDDINENVQTASAKLDTLSAGINNLGNSVVELTGAVNMGNALKSKASTSSEQLVSDSRYIRTLAEQQEIRRRNNL